MLIKPTNPMIKIIKGAIDSKNQSSPKGMKPFDLGGVGLGIVAALENSGESSNNRLPVNKTAVLRRNSCRSRPIPVKISARVRTEMGHDADDDDEEYTVVTCRDPKESYTKVYTDKGNDRSSFSSNAKRVGVFHISPADFAAGGGNHSSDFLSSCSMCRKKLHGLDIYMYRGEKAFCSAECRYEQIVIDERKEKFCSKEASKNVDVSSSSSSPYGNDQIFTMGILAS